MNWETKLDEAVKVSKPWRDREEADVNVQTARVWLEREDKRFAWLCFHGEVTASV